MFVELRAAIDGYENAKDKPVKLRLWHISEIIRIALWSVGYEVGRWLRGR